MNSVFSTAEIAAGPHAAQVSKFGCSGSTITQLQTYNGAVQMEASSKLHLRTLVSLTRTSVHRLPSTSILYLTMKNVALSTSVVFGVSSSRNCPMFNFLVLVDAAW